jgi:hypothetical protein
MRDETLLCLLDVLDGLTAGYRECAQRIYAAEYVLTQEKMYGAYVQARKRVMSGEPGLGLETERWNESAAHIEKVLAELRKQLLRSQA